MSRRKKVDPNVGFSSIVSKVGFDIYEIEAWVDELVKADIGVREQWIASLTESQKRIGDLITQLEGEKQKKAGRPKEVRPQLSEYLLYRMIRAIANNEFCGSISKTCEYLQRKHGIPAGTLRRRYNTGKKQAAQQNIRDADEPNLNTESMFASMASFLLGEFETGERKPCA
jgi:hypothetical protein